jgi:UPF0755 protein
VSDTGVGPEPIEPEHVHEDPHDHPDGAFAALSTPGRRMAHRPTRRGRGCLVALVAVVLLGVGVFAVGGTVVNKVKSLVGSAADYSGPGTGSVVIEVHSGDSASTIGQTLQSAGVVESVQAFTDAAQSDPRSRGIQVGYYAMKKQMKASAALAILVDPANLIQSRVLVPEGARVKDIVKAIVEHTKITEQQVRAALANPGSLGLPAQAHGKVEGYLFPATYSVVPGETAEELLRQMVAKAVAVDNSLGLSAQAARAGLTPAQVITVASILEYEGSRAQDYPKIARAIYNRLNIGMKLQSDATVAYANNLSGTVYTTDAERNNPSPYNTYVHAGLPPGPIGSPGVQTIEAALHPTAGPWLYWVVVNLRTGETVFSTTYAEHLRAVQRLQAYCQTSTAC